MSSHRHSGEHELGAEDPVFQSRSSFDLKEGTNDDGTNMVVYNTLAGANLEFDMSSDLDVKFSAQFFLTQQDHLNFSVTMPKSRLSNEGSTMDRDMSDFNSTVEAPPKHSNIVGSRNGQVAQVDRQMTTPKKLLPQTSKVSSRQVKSQDSGKLSNEQRARKAANARHFRAQSLREKSRKKSLSREDDAKSDVQSQKQEFLTIQREKNRIAAAKCRAKKKTANAEQEEMVNDFSATNNILTREIRELRNQKTELQNYILAHRPGVCECDDIHKYNLHQAQRLVLNAQRQAAVSWHSSPSQESALSAQSSESPGVGMIFPQPSPITSPEVMDIHFHTQSCNSPLRLNSHPTASQGGLLGDLSTQDEGQEMHCDFDEFLSSLPDDGQADFS